MISDIMQKIIVMMNAIIIMNMDAIIIINMDATQAKDADAKNHGRKPKQDFGPPAENHVPGWRAFYINTTIYNRQEVNYEP